MGCEKRTRDLAEIDKSGGNRQSEQISPLLNLVCFVSLLSPSLYLSFSTASLLGAPACYYTATLRHQALPTLTTKDEGVGEKDDDDEEEQGTTRIIALNFSSYF